LNSPYTELNGVLIWSFKWIITETKSYVFLHFKQQFICTNNSKACKFQVKKETFQNEGVQKNTPKKYVTRVLFPMSTNFELPTSLLC
jgi:hypothetical protein